MSLWDVASVETWGLGAEPLAKKLELILYISKLYHLRLRTYIE